MKNADMPAMTQSVNDSVDGVLIGSYMECEWSGLTKREDIAKHLMASLIQGGAISEIGNEKWYAERACKLTDALLAELGEE